MTQTHLPSVRFRVAASLVIWLLAVASVEGGVIRRHSTDDGCAALDAFQPRVEDDAVLPRQLAAALPRHL